MTADIESVSSTVPALSTPPRDYIGKGAAQMPKPFGHQDGETPPTRLQFGSGSGVVSGLGRLASTESYVERFRDWPIAQSIKQCQPIPFLSRPLPRTNSGPLTLRTQGSTC